MKRRDDKDATRQLHDQGEAVAGQSLVLDTAVTTLRAATEARRQEEDSNRNRNSSRKPALIIDKSQVTIESALTLLNNITTRLSHGKASDGRQQQKPKLRHTC